MTYTLFWRSKAYLDLDEAFAWYADHAPLQVNRLENEIVTAEQEIRENPLMYRRMLKDTRRFVLKIFPYRIWYTVNEAQLQIHVLAFVHTRRDPETYQRRFI